jgi:beta-phosphoglucomutase-like phosphatase (HAD superfamily)
MQEKMRKRLIIFDFDGTLGDTFERFPAKREKRHKPKKALMTT